MEKFLVGVFSEVDPAAFGRQLLRSKDEKIQAQVYLKLIEYKFGKPVQPTELSNKDGERFRVLVEHIGTAYSASA